MSADKYPRIFLPQMEAIVYIVAPQKFDALKTNICPRSEASRANMLVNIKFPRDNYQTDISET